MVFFDECFGRVIREHRVRELTCSLSSRGDLELIVPLNAYKPRDMVYIQEPITLEAF